MNDQEFSTVNELLCDAIVSDSIRHGKTKISKSVFEWHLSVDHDKGIVLVTYKNGETWHDDCYVDEVDEALIEHLAAEAQRKLRSDTDKLQMDDVQAKSYANGALRHSAAKAPKSEAFGAEVLHLFRHNRFVELVRKNLGKFHVGDGNIAELEMLSVASLSVKNTNGIQPKLSGESGKGKTHTAKSMLHLIHPSIYRAASFSTKALFYDKTLKAKMIIFSDDVNLPEDTEEIVRAAMSNWDTPTQHITLDSQRNPTTLCLPARIVFWLTSVKTTSSMQLLNRQVEANVDESPEQDRRVEQHQRKLSELGLPEFYVDDEVELLRQAFLHLNQIDYQVKIPFVARIKFNHVSNRRNLPIFLDFVKAYCILNYGARQIDDDGLLIAQKEDFDYACQLFKTIAVQQVTKLAEKERRVAEVIKQNTPCDILTIADETGYSFSYIYELIHGDKHSGNRGLLEKIPELRLFARWDIDPETGSPWGKNHYSLPEDWTLLSSDDSIVSWVDAPVQEKQLQSISDSFGDDFRNSKTGEEGFNDRKDPPSAGILDNANTNFATSEKGDAVSGISCSSTASASERNSERELKVVPNRPATGYERQIDVQNDQQTVSETQSEVERNTREQDGSANSPSVGNNVSHSNWHPSIIVPRRIDGKWVTYIKIRALESIPEFACIDGRSYKLCKNEAVHLPEANAKVLWRRKLAVLT